MENSLSTNVTNNNNTISDINNTNKEYLNTKIKHILEPLFFNLLTHRPDDVITFSLEYLNKQGGFTANGLTLDERQELTELRKELKQLRELKDIHNDVTSNTSDLNHISDSDSDSDNSDDIDSDLDEEKFRQKRDTIIARGPRIAVSAESYSTTASYTPIIHLKTEEEASSIKAKIINSFLFNSLDANELKIVVDAMEKKTFKKDETVIKQGDQGIYLFIVEKGELDCYKTFPNEERQLVNQYSEGDIFGELSLLYNTPRAAEVIAVNDVILWKLDRSTFNVIVKAAAV
jgi:cAMP-dependent protein kinase regulator